MKLFKRISPSFWIVLGSAVLLLFWAYGPIITNPNSYLFGADGDGIKNYYTYTYFIEKNSPGVEFEGMNYPYGESFMYTDCHPIQAQILKGIVAIFPALANYTIGILNFGLLFSFLLCALALHAVFRQLGASHFMSVLGPLAITILCPQVFRLTGHLALAYGFFLPLTLFFVLKIIAEAKARKYILFLGLALLFFFFTHGYLGMIAASFVLAFVGVKLVHDFVTKRQIELAQTLKLAGPTLLAMLVFYAFVKLSDHHTGRTNNAWGIYENHAEPASVFLPIWEGPVNSIKNTVLPNLKQPWEGWAYIGFFTVVGLLVIFSFWIKSMKLGKRKTRKKVVVVGHETLVQLFLAAVVLLLFSFLIPFRWGLEPLLEKLSLVKQFRGIGRFAWAFYFVATILVLYVVDQKAAQLRKKGMPILALLLLVFVPVSLAIEGVGYHKHTIGKIQQTPNLFDMGQTSTEFQTAIASLNGEDYQAILPFPFYYIGSESYQLPADNVIAQQAFLASYHLELPMFSSFLTRTSIWESKNIMQLLAENFYPKTIANDLPSELPFLVLLRKGYEDPKVKKWLKKAKKLAETSEMLVYSVPKRTFFENDAKLHWDDFEARKDSLYFDGRFYRTDSALVYQYHDFEAEKSDATFAGSKGAFSGLQKDYKVFLELPPNTLQPGRTYKARFWMYNAGENFGQDQLGGMFFFQKELDGNTAWLQPVQDGRYSTDIFGDWSLVEITLPDYNPEATYKLTHKGADFSTITTRLDRLLLYDSELEVFGVGEIDGQRMLVKNNHHIAKPN